MLQLVFVVVLLFLLALILCVAAGSVSAWAKRRKPKS